jgi:hypothetical protein
MSLKTLSRSPGKLKPIETAYNGLRFRSRLEARWAVFFDALNIKYLYEPEGFDLGDDIRYLPDFWLIEQQCWIEIKPSHLVIPSWYVFDKNDRPIIDRCKMLSTQSNNRVVLLTGDLRHLHTRRDDCTWEMIPYICWYGDDPDDSHEWCYCTICGAKDITYAGRADRCYCGHDQRNYDRGTWNIIPEAYAQARQARFEFGENGK